MRAVPRWCALTVAVFMLAVPGAARADETDNFTCRNRLTGDALAALDALMNDRIREAVVRANRHDGQACDGTCLFRELRQSIGGSYLHRLTLIPHSNFERWVDQRKDIERCHLRFRESIYGARAYNQPWLFPFNGRIIFLADSIRLSGRVVGLDKINHFIREGLAHWRAVGKPGGDITTVMIRELGRPGRPWRWNEWGLKGMSMTGILAYADLAASYSGFRFWTDLLSIDRAQSFIVFDDEADAFVQRRDFSFSEYVNDAWDEGVNYSAFHPALGRQVGEAVRRRALAVPVADCRILASLPHANLYVNPACVSTDRQR